MPLLRDIRERGTPPDTSVLQGTFDAQTQADLCNRIAKELGFDLSKGRLDVSVHPFTGGRLPVPNVEKPCLLASCARRSVSKKDIEISANHTDVWHLAGAVRRRAGRRPPGFGVLTED